MDEERKRKLLAAITTLVGQYMCIDLQSSMQLFQESDMNENDNIVNLILSFVVLIEDEEEDLDMPASVKVGPGTGHAIGGRLPQAPSLHKNHLSEMMEDPDKFKRLHHFTIQQFNDLVEECRRLIEAPRNNRAVFDPDDNMRRRHRKCKFSTAERLSSALRRLRGDKYLLDCVEEDGWVSDE
jgi:hypothetical protein